MWRRLWEAPIEGRQAAPRGPFAQIITAACSAVKVRADIADHIRVDPDAPEEARRATEEAFP